MKEDDIDKIFRDALADQTARTDESDWAAFEGMLGSRKSAISKWTVLIVLIILISGSAAAYIFLSQTNAQYNPRAENTSTPSGEGKIDELNQQESDHTELSKSSSFDEVLTKKDNDSNVDASIIEDEQVGNDASVISDRSSKTNSADRDDSDLSDGTDATTSGGYENKEARPKDELGGNKKDTPAITSSGNLALYSDERGAYPDKGKVLASSSEGVENDALYADKPIASSELALENPELMTMLGTELVTHFAPVVKEDKRSVELPKRQLFTPFIYFKLEQNSVLQTSPALGLGVERSFPLQGKAAIAVQAAVGYQRSGRLAWEQTSQNVMYGFDRYAEESKLMTDNLGMIQIPIRLAYQRGVHRLLAGVEMNWVVNASQEFRQLSEGLVEEGYLYDSGAPNSALFFQLGYGYAINEKFQLDLSLNIAGNSWVVVDKRPIGGLIRLNYFIR